MALWRSRRIRLTLLLLLLLLLLFTRRVFFENQNSVPFSHMDTWSGEGREGFFTGFLLLTAGYRGSFTAMPVPELRWAAVCGLYALHIPSSRMKRRIEWMISRVGRGCRHSLRALRLYLDRVRACVGCMFEAIVLYNAMSCNSIQLNATPCHAR